MDTISCVQSMIKYLARRGITIKLDGSISKALTPYQYRLNVVRLCCLLLIICLAYIIRIYSYHPITIIGNSIYSRVIASALSYEKKPFVLSRGFQTTLYYESNDGKEIPFEGVSPNYFNSSLDKKAVLIPMTQTQLAELESHTKLKNLESIQNKVLSRLSNTTEIKNLIHNGTNIKSPILSIKRFLGGLYYITTATEVWISKLIISDAVLHVQAGDVISGLYVTEKSQSDSYSTKDENDNITILTRKDAYLVDQDCNIIANDVPSDTECILYNLKHPRPFVLDGIHMVHPFHLPPTWDPFLTIHVITRALVF